MIITSVQNPKVKQWNKLKKRKERVNSKTFLIEGHHLVQEAATSSWNVQEIIVEEGTEQPQGLPDVPVTYVSDNVFKSISDTKTPQGIAAIVEMKELAWGTYEKLLLLDAIQDPGNLGTIIRTADAAGFDAVVLGEGTVDLFNDKVIRATQGSIFHIPIFQESLLDLTPKLQNEGYDVWASALDEAKAYQTLKLPTRVALILGNEGAGIHQNLIDLADQKVIIPIYGRAESLNVSVAAGILIYHIANQA
jgi:RNA methyltransferase, TrmH family